MLTAFTLAHAQSSVTLFGVLDAGLLYTNKTVDSATGQNAGRQFSLINSGLQPSHFGLEGQEDLGGGLAAKFRLESGIDLANGGFDNSNGGLFGRQAWVSLIGNYGEVKVGLQPAPFIDAIYDSDARSFAQFGSMVNVAAASSINGFFTSNAITYESPKVFGFTGKVMMVLGGVAGDFKAGREYSASLKYEFGGLLLNAAFMNEPISTDATIDSNPFTAPLSARTFGISYNFPVMTVKASFTNYNAPEVFNNGIRSGGDDNLYGMGFDYHVLPAILDVSSDVYYVKDQHESSSHALEASLAAEYYLSRRTTLYAQVGIANNQGTENLGLSLDGAFTGVRGTTTGMDVGILHKF
jgi:predicted porin